MKRTDIVRNILKYRLYLLAELLVLSCGWKLMVCCILCVFAYDFRLLPTSLQKVTFCRAKGYLLTGEKPYLASLKVII